MYPFALARTGMSSGLRELARQGQHDVPLMHHPPPSPVLVRCAAPMHVESDKGRTKTRTGYSQQSSSTDSHWLPLDHWTIEKWSEGWRRIVDAVEKHRQGLSDYLVGQLISFSVKPY
jgi:hypothetical protein